MTRLSAGLAKWCLAAATMPTAAGAQDPGLTVPPDFGALVDSVVVETMEEQRIPGAAVAVVDGARVVLLRGYGLADVERGVPVEPERTLFRIGSVTKALTALAVLQLVERGAVDLDGPVADHLPHGFVDEAFGEPIRVRHLLSHSGGFDQVGLRRQVDDPARRPSLEDFLRRELVRVRPPGVVGVYDTYGMTLAGHVVERVSGVPYAEYLRRRLFEPLGMRRAFVETPDSLRDDLAVGYGLEDDGLVPQPYEWYVTLPASSVDATAADMGRLLVALLGDGSTESGRILDEETVRRIRSVPQLAYGPEMAAFSWGFWEERRGGYRALHHGGVMRGYSSELYLVPEAGVGLFVAYNRDPETGPPPRLRERLVDLLHERLLPTRPAPPPTVPVAVPTERFAGAYGGTVGCFTCSEGEGWGIGTLRLEAPEPGVLAMGGRRWLAIDSTVFLGEESGAPIRFLTDDRERVRYMVQGPNSYARLDEHLLEELLGADWRDRPPAPLVAVVLRANERWAEAADAYASLARRDPENGTYAFYEGFSALNAGRPERALAAFERALRAGKWRAWSQYYVACSRAAMGQDERALTELDRAVEMRFGDPDLLRTEDCWDGLREDARFRDLLERVGG